MSGLLGYVPIFSIINTLRLLKCSVLATFQLLTEVWFHDKPSKKHIGSSPEADSPRSNDRHFEGNDLCQDRVSKLLAMITSVKGSQEIKMRSYLYLLGVMVHRKEGCPL